MAADVIGDDLLEAILHPGFLKQVPGGERALHEQDHTEKPFVKYSFYRGVVWDNVIKAWKAIFTYQDNREWSSPPLLTEELAAHAYDVFARNNGVQEVLDLNFTAGEAPRWMYDFIFATAEEEEEEEEHGAAAEAAKRTVGGGKPANLKELMARDKRFGCSRCRYIEHGCPTCSGRKTANDLLYFNPNCATDDPGGFKYWVLKQRENKRKRLDSCAACKRIKIACRLPWSSTGCTNRPVAKKWHRKPTKEEVALCSL